MANSEQNHRKHFKDFIQKQMSPIEAVGLICCRFIGVRTGQQDKGIWLNSQQLKHDEDDCELAT